MSAETISTIEAVTGILDRDQNKNPIVARYAYHRQQVYKIRLSTSPRTKNQKTNSNRFRQAALALKGIYHSPPLLTSWRSHYIAAHGIYRNRQYKNLRSFIFANLLDSIAL